MRKSHPIRRGEHYPAAMCAMDPGIYSVNKSSPNHRKCSNAPAGKLEHPKYVRLNAARASTHSGCGCGCVSLGTRGICHINHTICIRRHGRPFRCVVSRAGRKRVLLVADSPDRRVFIGICWVCVCVRERSDQIVQMGEFVGSVRWRVLF